MVYTNFDPFSYFQFLFHAVKNNDKPADRQFIKYR